MATLSSILFIQTTLNSIGLGRRLGPGDLCEMCGADMHLTFFDGLREYRCTECNHFFAASSDWGQQMSRWW
eukprot:g80627.t1